MLAELAGVVVETGVTPGETQVVRATIALTIATIISVPVILWSVLTETRRMRHDDDMVHLLLEKEQNRHEEKMQEE